MQSPFPAPRWVAPSLALLVWANSLVAQTFQSGSDGHHGALNVTNYLTLDLPPDGIFHFTTVTVAAGKTLRFNRNSMNTPVYLLATGEAFIGGIIDISASPPIGVLGGLGGPGGFDGGNSGTTFGGLPNGSGLGPGGGSAYQGAAFAANGAGTSNNGRVYGNAALMPLIGGSGGAGSDSRNPGGGGGGGGAILVASPSRITVDGRIMADGGSIQGTWAGSGSGGAIKLVAPIVSGSGTLSVAGGSHGWPNGYGGSASIGRIRIDCLDRFAFRQLIYRGSSSRGSTMIAIPSNSPRLEILEAAGQTISPNTQTTVLITLPPSASRTNVVRVRAVNFTNNVPLRVVVTPENGPGTTYDAEIDMRANPPQVEVSVVLTENQANRIYAWTR